MSRLNYPVGGAFHLEPSVPLFIADGARLHCFEREIHSIEENEKVNIRQRPVVEPRRTSSMKLYFLKSPGPVQACSSWFSIPLSSWIKTFLGLLPLVLVGAVSP